MIKVIGLLLIILAGTGAGVYASAALSRRAASCERLERLIGYMSMQIKYTAAPIQEILEQAAKGGEFQSLPFLAEASILIQCGQRPDEALEEAVKEASRQGEDWGFNEGDRELLFQFGRGLGKSDVDGQLAHCEAYRRLVEDRLQAAKGEATAKGKLYITLGVSAGLAVALLLL